MGPWNELFLACDLKPDVPQQVVDILNYLINPPFDPENGEIKPIIAPNHQFFRQIGWEMTLIGHCYYFSGDIFSLLAFDEKFNYYKFTVRTMVKLGGDLISAFLVWLAPYSETNGYVGYTYCDE